MRERARMVNHANGRHRGPSVFHWAQSRFFDNAALNVTHAAREENGGKTPSISRCQTPLGGWRQYRKARQGA